MNKIFKIKRNGLGQSVVTSELAKNKGKTASVVAVLLSALFSIGAANATPVSIQGTATSENAVSVGSNSYATAVDGVATGQGSIATGQGFTREEFAAKVEENQAAVDAVNAKQDEVNNKGNQLDATNDAIDSLGKQIDDLTQQQADIADKIAKREDLLDKQADAQDKVDSSQSVLDEIQEKLDSVSLNGKNIFLDFKDVLNSLDWSKLSASDDIDANRNALAQDLKEIVVSLVPDIAAKYDDKKYRDTIDGYLNRQASYQGTYEYLQEQTKHNVDGFTDKILINDFVYNTGMDKTDYSVTDDYKYSDADTYYLYRTEGYIRNQSVFKDYIDEKEKLNNNGGTDWKPYFIRGNQEEKELNNIVGQKGKLTYYGYLKQLNDQSVYNTLYLVDMSSQQLNADNIYNPLLGDMNGVAYITYKTNLVLEDGTNFSDFYNDLSKTNADANRIKFGVKVDANYKERNSTIFFGMGGDSVWQGNASANHNKPGVSYSPRFYDDNLTIISKIKDFTVDNNNLITTQNISDFKTFLSKIKTFYNSIDWDYEQSPINLTSYKASFDKVIAYNEKINNFAELNQLIINERKKNDFDSAQIDKWTQQLMSLRNEILEGINDKTNFGMGIELEYNKEWADYYLYYGKEKADHDINRMNNELRLYDDKDEFIVDVTEQAKAIQAQYDEAAKKLAEDKAALDKLNKEIDDLELTDSEKAVNDTKRDKEQELADRLADKERLEDEIAKGNEELEKLREALSQTELKELGLRSQAHGSNAFASGNDSIAMGTNATVISNDGIAIGRDTIVTGEQSIAIGADAIVTGAQSSTIGVNNLVTGDNNAVIGNDNTVKSNNVMVLGNNINIAEGFDGAVVLGNGSAVAKANPTTSITLQNKEYTFAGINPESVVSVGAEGVERQIINVAAGRISETSTDAVNGSQLYALAAALEDSKLNQDQLDEIQDQIDSAGWKVTIDSTTGDATGGTVAEVKNGNTVTFVAGDNIALEQTDTTITINAVATTDTKTTINAGNGLKAEEQVNGDNVVYNIGLDDVTKAQIEKETEVVAGTSGNVIVSRSKNETGGNTYTVDLSDSAKNQLNKDTTVSGNNGISVTVNSVTNANGGTTTNYEVSLGDSITEQINKEEDVIGSDAVSVVQNGQNNTGGNRFVVDLSATTKAQLAKETTVSGENGISVKAETSTNANGGTTTNYIVSLAADLVNQIAKEENVVAGSDAVTVVQNGQNETGGNTFVVDLSEQTKAQLAKETSVSEGSTYVTVNIDGTNETGGSNYAVDLSDDTKALLAKEEDVVAGKSGNIQVTQEGTNGTGGNTFVVELTKDVNLGTDGSFKAGDIIVEGNKISGVGTPVDAGDVANKDYVDNSHTTVSSGDTINIIESVSNTTTGAKDYNVSINKAGTEQLLTVKYAGDNGSGENSLSEAITFTGDEYIVTNAENGKVTTGLSEQAKTMLDSTQKGLNFADSNGTTVNRQLGDTLNVIGDANGNINTQFDDNGNLVVSLNETVKAGDITINNNGKITGVADGEISPVSKDAVNGSQLFATNINVARNAANIAKGFNTETDDGQTVNYQLGDTIKVTGDSKNLSTTTTADGKVSVRMADDIKVNSVTAGHVSLSTTGINAGGNKVTNVAPGEVSPTSMDAVNGSQLYALGDTLMQNIENVDARAQQGIRQLDAKVNKLDKKRKAGMASALATAGLPQPHREGQSGFVAGVGQYQGETGVAVGYSRISDNGKWIIRASASTNTRKEVGGQIGVGYFW